MRSTFTQRCLPQSRDGPTEVTCPPPGEQRPAAAGPSQPTEVASRGLAPHTTFILSMFCALLALADKCSFIWAFWFFSFSLLLATTFSSSVSFCRSSRFVRDTSTDLKLASSRAFFSYEDKRTKEPELLLPTVAGEAALCSYIYIGDWGSYRLSHLLSPRFQLSMCFSSFYHWKQLLNLNTFWPYSSPHPSHSRASLLPYPFNFKCFLSTQTKP